MKIKSAVFDVSAPDLASCPESSRPEFAFIGRSNVGKSSLINLITEKRDLANVSVTPGKTKLINFFLINHAWHLVDLPGYGYAEVSKTQRAEFNEAVADYLEHRQNIFCVFVLIDSRIPPQQIDVDFIRWLGGCEMPFALVFTKSDKQSATQTQSNIAVFKKRISEWLAEPPPSFTTSAKTKSGRGEILKFIESALTETKGDAPQAGADLD